MRELSREPLVHFALAALVLFGFHLGWTSWSNRSQNTIHVTNTEMDRLVALYTSESGSPPTGQDIQAMVADHVRNEALAREARRLSLHVGDTIVDRRLAQKMSFLVSDLTTLKAPTDEELRTWYRTHPDRFSKPARVTFDHVFFSAEKRKDTVRQDAQTLLNELGKDQRVEWRKAGDPFMLSRSYGDLPLREAARIFGPEFTKALAETPAASHWQGPLTSAFGVHLVRVTRNEKAERPPLEDVRKAVETDWEDAMRRQANADAIRAIVGKYRVVIEGPDER